MLPIFLLAAGALLVAASSGGKKTGSSPDPGSALEGAAADAALDEIIDDETGSPGEPGGDGGGLDFGPITGMSAAKWTGGAGQGQTGDGETAGGSGSSTAGPRPRARSAITTRSGPKRTQAKTMESQLIIRSLPTIRKVDWSKKLKGKGGSSSTARLNHPPCDPPKIVTTVVINRAKIVEKRMAVMKLNLSK